MRESGYYPPGAEFDPNAPWNQVDPPEVTYDATATVVLRKDDEVCTDMVYCDDGDISLCEDVTVKELWNDSHIDIPTLLDELVKYIDAELTDKPSSMRADRLHMMKRSAQNWVMIEDDYEIN